MKIQKNKKGFTLIEVLIVVVIIGILAALLLPRMLTQPERARVAEANQMLGTIRRAQVTLADAQGTALANGAVPGLSLDQTAANIGNWALLGLQNQGAVPGGSFTYTCTAGAGVDGTCTATRNAGGPLAGATATITLGTGAFACAGGYVVSAAPGGGCRT